MAQEYYVPKEYNPESSTSIDFKIDAGTPDEVHVTGTVTHVLKTWPGIVRICRNESNTKWVWVIVTNGTLSIVEIDEDGTVTTHTAVSFCCNTPDF